tara:strand:- start:14044 stop:15879 length:1836 start_codon:yes stop_codon:yes gene_type:complete
MLNTLHKIGEQLLEGQGAWARLTTEPKFKPDKKNWVCPILFDCINSEIQFQKKEIELFKKDSSSISNRYIPPAIWGPRGKKCALTVEEKNFKMLEETLFGKKVGDQGSMLESIEDYDEKLIDSSLSQTLKKINSELSELRSALDLKAFKEDISLGNGEAVVLFYAIVKSEDINGGKPIPLYELDGYEDFVIGKFGSVEKGEKGINYLTGNSSEEVIEASFSGRYNIHKIFQTTASNYASGFLDFKKNFQATSQSLSALDKASEYVLNKLQTRIAGINHITIPSLLHKDLDEFDVTETELFLNKTSDLLFNYSSLNTPLEQELSHLDVFWVNYFAFESDGNSFKIINHIKDVNSLFLIKTIEAFASSGIEFKNFIGDKYRFNLQTIYHLIPVKDGQKSKKNVALGLFKSILEQQIIDQNLLFDHFISLLLCHWYKRYPAYQNVRESESFDFAVKDIVFKYSALLYALKKLNLIKMENESTAKAEIQEKNQSEFQQRMESFFIKMDYSEYEKSMFYLGRVLSSIAYAQYKKGHESKPVLNKINFTGMDTDSIIRLSLDLAEKARQYNIHRETDWDFARFRENFNGKDWSLTKEQNVFYLMAGYSFGLTKSNND